MDGRISLGRRGEEAAAAHLRRRGWRIIARNWRGGHGGELDLVALRGAVLAVCEVKVRRSADWPVPVSAAQRQRIVAGAAAFLAAHPEHGHRTVHLDLLLAIPRGRRWTVRHTVRALEW